MVRIIRMYIQITINLRGPPPLLQRCYKFVLISRCYSFPIINTGEPQPQELSRRLSTAIVATANARHPLLPIVIQEGVILIKLRE